MPAKHANSRESRRRDWEAGGGDSPQRHGGTENGGGDLGGAVGKLGWRARETREWTRMDANGGRRILKPGNREWFHH